jgi:hypothetical protein
MAYYFAGEDGCPVCEAMAGVYDDEPDRPHPYCECDITPVDDDFDPKLYQEGRPCVDDSGIEPEPTERDSNGFWITGNVWVECCDGERHEQEYGEHFDATADGLDAVDEWEQGAQDLLEEMESEHCVPDPPEEPEQTDPEDDFGYA